MTISTEQFFKELETSYINCPAKLCTMDVAAILAEMHYSDTGLTITSYAMLRKCQVIEYKLGLRKPIQGINDRIRACLRARELRKYKEIRDAE